MEPTSTPGVEVPFHGEAARPATGLVPAGSNRAVPWQAAMMPGLGGMDPRQMAMMMRKMGIQVEEIDDVTEVLVRTKKRDYRFRKASVSVMKAQGTETWQVVGKPETIERAASEPAALPGNVPASAPAPSNVPLSIPEEDVRLVMEQTGCDTATARRTLEATGGDLAEALVRLGK